MIYLKGGGGCFFGDFYEYVFFDGDVVRVG